MQCDPRRLDTSRFERAPGLAGTPNFAQADTPEKLATAYAQLQMLSYGGAGYLQDVHRFRTRQNMYPDLVYTQNRCGGGFDAIAGMAGKTWDSTVCGQVESYARARTQTTPEFMQNGFDANGGAMRGYATPFDMTPYNPSVAM